MSAELNALQKEARDWVAANRETLLKRAEGFLQEWHGRNPIADVVYQLNDQDHFFDLFDDMHRDDEEDLYCAIGEAELGAIGDIQVWIEAAKNLGYQDYVDDLERILKEGI